MITHRLSPLSLALATALLVVGCGGGSSGYNDEPPPVAAAPPANPPADPPTQPTGESFTEWSRNGVFAKPADGAPEIMDELVFNFDGDDNPDAYSDLLPPSEG